MYKAFKLNSSIFLLIIVGLLAVGNTSCKDIFEDELGEEEVILLSPANNDTLNNSVQTFWWKELDDNIAISNYKIELVTPSFENVKKTILDTIMLKNKFDFNLVALEKDEQYQWRVRAENSTSETPYSTASFYVSNETTLSKEQLILSTPNSGDSLNVKTSGTRFEWQKMEGAEAYVIQIDDQLTIPFGANENTLEVNQNVPSSEDFYNDFSRLTRNQTYYWRVRATGQTSTNVSQWSDVRRVIIKGN